MIYLKNSIMTKVDDFATDRIKIENLIPLAGQRIAEFIVNKSELDLSSGITLLLGRGPNGGDGIFALAYLLDHYDYKGSISIFPGWNINEKTHGLEFVDKKFKEMSSNYQVVEIIPTKGIILDGLLGYKLNREPNEEYAKIIEEANKSGLPIVSIDLPSGLETESGTFYKSHINPNLIISLDVCKFGLEQFSKILYVADLGFESKDYEHFGVKYNRPFTKDKKIVKVSETF